MHLILYDHSCPLCNRAVRFLLAHDKRKRFLFSPLQGKKAKEILKSLPKELDTLIFVENYGTKKQKVYLEGKGVLKICLHLGGLYTLLGLFSFLPSFAFDFFYRFIAKRRYRLFSPRKSLEASDFQGRFLP